MNRYCFTPEFFVIFSLSLLPNSTYIHTHTHTHETIVITFKDNIEKMSEIIFEIIARSITLKAKQEEEEERKSTVIVYKKQEKIQEKQ